MEYLAVVERKDAYRFMISSLNLFSPNMNPVDVFVFSSDAFLDEDFVKEFFLIPVLYLTDIT